MEKSIKNFYGKNINYNAYTDTPMGKQLKIITSSINNNDNFNKKILNSMLSVISFVEFLNIITREINGKNLYEIYEEGKEPENPKGLKTFKDFLEFSKREELYYIIKPRFRNYGHEMIYEYFNLDDYEVFKSINKSFKIRDKYIYLKIDNPSIIKILTDGESDKSNDEFMIWNGNCENDIPEELDNLTFQYLINYKKYF